MLGFRVLLVLLSGGLLPHVDMSQQVPKMWGLLSGPGLISKHKLNLKGSILKFASSESNDESLSNGRWNLVRPEPGTGPVGLVGTFTYTEEIASCGLRFKKFDRITTDTYAIIFVESAALLISIEQLEEDSVAQLVIFQLIQRLQMFVNPETLVVQEEVKKGPMPDARYLVAPKLAAGARNFYNSWMNPDIENSIVNAEMLERLRSKGELTPVDFAHLLPKVLKDRERFDTLLHTACWKIQPAVVQSGKQTGLLFQRDSGRECTPVTELKFNAQPNEAAQLESSASGLCLGEAARLVFSHLNHSKNAVEVTANPKLVAAMLLTGKLHRSVEQKLPASGAQAADNMEAFNLLNKLLASPSDMQVDAE